MTLRRPSDAAPRGRRSLLHLALLGATLLSLAGCDIPGLGPDPRVLQREAEARAIGGACRHALRGLEDCFTLNPKAPKALVFAGWKDMDQYMRENKLEGTPSVLTELQKPAAEAPAARRSRDADEADEGRSTRNRG
ncbi:hypothetical protein [Melaminivora alkalimesophila]|uniref:Uncharacterized protein n=1 Tax=Melaminivora alkalimesophila TaxID=1165852 RepID=A0A317RKG4_9BURK|nr:hypothetical protein [Melaminivora alkalimesophila]PWW48940.1 hypothetical protein DFR36_101451 [Melaminivora alkalimesophila]